MTVFFRALVMLLALVGLPAAWIYYGPLPPNAQRIVDRFVEVVCDALDWKSPMSGNPQETVLKTAPRYAEPFPAGGAPAVSQADYREGVAPVQLASTSSIPSPPGLKQTSPPTVEDEMQRHLSLLKNLGVAEYALEKWGNGYRFKCEIPLGENLDFTQHFEAVSADPLATVRQVVGEVTSWQNARHDASGTVWR